MDILNQTESILRQAGYETWRWSGGDAPIVCFEDLSVLGFVHVFGTAKGLLNGWEDAQKTALARFASALKMAGLKAWNVYSVFLTNDGAELTKEIEQLEENFSLTRKIARSGIQTSTALRQTLLTLLPVSSQPILDQIDFDVRLRSRLKGSASLVADPFLGDGSPQDIAQMLGDLS